MSEPADARLRERLRAQGFRMTAQRERVLRAVDELGHATPDEVHEHVRGAGEPAVNISTVYRTLEVLEQLGLVRHAHLSDRAPTYHSVRDHEHFHLVCRGCGTVIARDTATLGEFADELRREHDFTADLGHLTVFGWCAPCTDRAGVPATDDSIPEGPTR